MKKIENIINRIRINKGDNEISEFQKNMSLRDDIGFDSLDLAELTVLIEDEYNIDIFESGIVSTLEEIHERLLIDGGNN